ncbi:hypothetical protein GE061_011335 [Apolygus lucorum]|uniref:Uncharacterized protein n=1 Tax=Apolygus lucorum TaxID=248454 RepID=A0A6A4K0P0_APOLU|nr:hypothetical protein GE061_011335 [Apolygus lucorum]
MGRKKSKNNQSSNTPVGGNVNADSSDSNEHNEKNALTVNCNHIAKSVNFNQVAKGLKNGEDLKKNFCPICVKESQGLKGSDLFVCLKCGTKTCCKEHSKAHFAVPRSDLHSLAYDFTSKILWCYGCSCEINEREAKNKNLSTCVISLNRQLTTFAAKEKAGSAKVVENSTDNNERDNDPSSQKGSRGKKFQQRNKPVVHQSPLSSVPVRGLSNLGNTCYFNSVMQCLARTRPLLMELKDMDHKVDVKIELKGGDTLEGCLEKWDPMSECLYETLTALLTAGPVLVPSKFLGCVRKRHPQFEGYDQHDSHELLRHTLDSIKMNDLKRYRRLMLAKKGLNEKVDPKQVPEEMHKQMKELEHRVTQVQNFIPEKTFKGKLVSRVECQDCNHSSEYIEGFLDLSLPVLADKPHPPVAKRKNGCASEPQYEESSNVRSTSARRHDNIPWQKKRNMKRAEELRRERKGQGDVNEVVDEVAVEAQESLADRPNLSLGLDEDKPHESGYSSEKASSSLRGSPSSEEVRSSSPCDDSWSTVPQFTDSWLSSLPGGIMLPVQGSGELSPNLVNRPPTHIPLHADGTPDLTYLTLHDSNGSTLKPLCQDTQTIMEQEPYWRDRIHQRYFINPSLEAENDQHLARLGEHEDLSHGSHSNETPTPDDTPAVTSHIDEISKDASSLQGNVSEDVRKTETLTDLENPLHSSTVTSTAEPRDANRSPPFRRNVQINSQKRDSSFSPVREEEGDSMHNLSLGTIQETNQEKSGFNSQPLEVSSPAEACEEYFRAKREENRPLSEFSSEDANQTKFPDVAGFFDQGSMPLRFGGSFACFDENSECDDDWPSFQRSQKNGNCDDLGNHVQNAPNNSLDSEGNESGNEKSMNTCSEEFPDELLHEDSPKKNIIDAETNQVNGEGTGECLSKEADESLPENLLDLSEDGDFEPLLDSLPSNSKLSIVCSDDVKNEPELHELCDKLRITDDGSNSSKLNVPEDTPKAEFTIDDKNEITSLMQKRESSKDLSECSIESCLRQFTSIEVMTGSNKVGCSACTERQNKGAKDGKTVLTMATKQLLIGQAPPILILHLKRFQVQLHSFRKLSKHVSFPLVLDLAPFCTSIGEDKNKVTNAEPMPYSLYGIVEHRGTLNSGHYVAYVKMEEENKRRWFCISDSHVNEVTEERVLKTEAYLLFYSRITFPHSP